MWACLAPALFMFSVSLNISLVCVPVAVLCARSASGPWAHHPTPRGLSLLIWPRRLDQPPVKLFKYLIKVVIQVSRKVHILGFQVT